MYNFMARYKSSVLAKEENKKEHKERGSNNLRK